MKSIKRLVSTAIIAVLAFSAVGCNMIAKTPEAIAKSSVAVVNGEKITKGDLDKNPAMMQLVAQMKQQYGDNYQQSSDAQSTLKDQEKQIVDQMVTEKVLEQKAKELNLLPDDSKVKAEADKQIADIKQQQFGGDEAKFQDALKQQNFTEDSLKNLFYTQLRNQEISNKLTDYVTKDIKIDDKQVLDYYNKNTTQFTEKPNTMHLAHILVKTQDEAKAVKARLDKGEDFAKVAKEVSQDPGSKDKGGDLGDVPYNNSGMDPQFMAGATLLKAGQISDPVQSQFGYHIIKCISIQQYPVKKFDTVKDQIRKQLEDQQKSTTFSQKVDEWKKAAKITTYEKNF